MSGPRMTVVTLLTLVLLSGFLVPLSEASFTGNTTSPTTFTASTAFNYGGAIVYDHPLFYWELDDAAASSSFADASASNRPGINPAPDSGTAAARYQVPGAPVGDGDKAAFFDGAGSYVVSNADEDSTSDYSIELWFRSSSTNGGVLASCFNEASPTDSKNRMMYIDSGGRLTYGDWTSSTNAVQSVRSGSAINDGQWHQAVGVHSGTNLTLYLDGASQGTASSPQWNCPGLWALGGADVGWSGWPNTPTSNYLSASIDDFAFYKTGLTAAQVLSHRNAISNGTGYANAVMADSPRLYWRLDEAPLTVTAADSSPHSATGHYYLTDHIVGAQPGALISTPQDATWFSGRQTSAYQPALFYDPNPFTILVWFRTTTRRGGVLAGFATEATGPPLSYDRHIYMLNDGRLAFGVFAGGTTNVIYSTANYNDGQWHLAVASLGVAGTKLYVEGVLVGQSSATTAQNMTGYWRLGGSTLDNWPDAPSSGYYTGWLDEFAVYDKQLSDARVAQLYSLR